MFKSLSTKLILAFVLVSGISIVAVSFQNYKVTKDSLTKASFERLTGLREAKSNNIEQYFKTVSTQIKALAEDPLVITAMQELTDGFNSFEKDSASTLEQRAEYKKILRNYYETDFMHRLQKKEPQIKNIAKYIPKDELSQLLQYTYIAANPYSTTGKGNMVTAPEVTTYSKAHEKYHPLLRNFKNRFKDLDLFLVEPKNGFVVYSANKKTDFATNLRNGPYRNSKIAVAFNNAMQIRKGGQPELTDYARYAPSYLAPSAFISTPLFMNNKLIGVLILQLNSATIDNIINGSKDPENKGFGQSGETYIVGSDYLMRSNSRFLKQSSENYLEGLQRTKTYKNTFKIMRLHGTTALLQQAVTNASRRAFTNQSGIVTGKDYRGVEVLSSYTPLNIKGLNWALVTKIDSAEIYAPLEKMKKTTTILTLIIMAFTTILALLISRSITSQLLALISAVERLRENKDFIKVEVLSNDEIGRLTEAFNVMARNSRAADFGRILNESHNEIFIFDAVTLKFVEINQGARKNLGYTQEELLRLQVFKILPEYNEGSFKNVLEPLRCVKEDKLVFTTFQQRKDETAYPVEIHLQVTDLNNKPAFIAFSLDISGKQDMENKLWDKGRILTKAQKISHIGNWDWNIVTDKLWWSDEIYRIFGLSPQKFEATYEGFLKRIPEEERETVRLAINQSLSSKKPYNLDHSIIMPNKEIHIVHGEGSVTFDKSGTAVRMIGTVQDVTEQRQAQDDLIKARNYADQANMAKSEFLSSMSHEIRTPMNAIIGMSELLSQTSLSEEQQEYVRTFQRAASSLLSLIDNILDVSKIEAGELELDHAPFKLSEILEDVCEIMAVDAHKKGLELTQRSSPEVPSSLIGDSARLSQILLHLIGNAIKFTEKGEVKVEISIDKNISDNKAVKTLLFTVTDTGIGLAEDEVNNIFDKYTRRNSSSTRKYGGMGLGLDISKKICELFKGRMWFESKLGVGTTFFFTASFQINYQTIAEPQEVYIDLKNTKALVVDDNATNRKILHELLSSLDVKVTEVASGKECLEILKDKGSKEFGLVLLDCHMPDMDGFEVAEHIREDFGLLEDSTMMMLTSDLMAGDKLRSKKLNIAHHMSKPIKKSAMLKAIQQSMKSKKTHEKDENIEAVFEDTRALGILLAEDVEGNRHLIKSYLKKTPYKLDIAEDGLQAVGKFKENVYDIVLMDMQMPNMDGYTATREIRKWEKENNLAATPIIALTAHALKGDAEKSIEAGCDGHTTKPIRKKILFKTIFDYTREDKSCQRKKA